jgi:SAM-dependent methyltransferase
MRTTFERILGLPPERSDNAGRVARVLAFASQWFPDRRAPTLLDVGAGLCVFPYRMKQAGWGCTALDPDPRAAEHARAVVGVDAVVGDFLSLAPSALGQFDVITFNKVLEHVDDPARMLRRAASHLAAGGFVYLEVPDVAAAAEGAAREEFFIEHLHVFSPASVAMLAERSGFSPVVIERLREPSSKYTVRGFLAVGGGA